MSFDNSSFDTQEDIKVLLADDEPDVLQVMAKKVGAAGFNVVTAVDGEDTWNKIVSESPDVIVLDLTMPKKDGLEILKTLRDNPPSQKWQPVIIVSGRRELEDMQKGFSLEADHYITKPCQADDIIKSIRLMLRLIPQRKAPSS